VIGREKTTYNLIKKVIKLYLNVKEDDK